MSDDKTLAHIGVARRSGRYPWGSGEDPQRSKSFRQRVDELKEKGLSQVEIAEGLGMSTTELRARISLDKVAQRKADAAMAQRLKEKGYSNVEIGKRMGGINESSVRSLLNPAMQERAAVTEATVAMLKKEVDEKKYLDVGVGIETQLGVSKTKLDTALYKLCDEGYKIQYIREPQVGTGKLTSLKVLTKEDVGYRELVLNKDKIRAVTNWSDDGGRSYLGLEPIKHVDSKRIMVRHVEDGGADMDGVIQLRRGVKDLSLGEKRYAQVRIGVDGTHYMKGMAIYADEMPDGVDIIYNSNKSKNDGKFNAFKELKVNKATGQIDEDNPFGATVRQKWYTDEKGNKQLSPLNIVGFPTKPNSGEEGSWGTWSKTLSSQFLSKQTPALAKQQLKLSLDIQKAEFDDIMSVTNPAVKMRLLDSFADDCDSKAVHLKAAALPRQGSKVLLPLTSLKENECYTKSYSDGTKLVLVRHPHGGRFELPIVTVNNKNKEGLSVLGDATDAIGIHPKTAQRLSGADFDGDSVLTIVHTGQIQVSPALKGLQDFDTKTAYPGYEGMKVMTSKNKQTEMGKASNLITDMTLKGASEDEIVRAVKHSMVVIDSEKHKLNYRQSYIDNGIAQLRVRYQGGTLQQPKGASTLISKAASEIRVPTRRPVTKDDAAADPSLEGVIRRNEYSVDPKTGKKVFVNRNETYVDPKTGKTIVKTIISSKMYEESDAHKLSSGTLMEKVYGDYANDMKRLGDQARKESVAISPMRQSKSARITYSAEVSSLRSKLALAVANKPKERQAQLLANSVVKAKKDANPDLKASEIKKLKGQSLEEARRRTGAAKQHIEITDKEWEAIQAGAVSHNVLTQILSNSKIDSVKQLAMPKTTTGLSEVKMLRAKNLLASGYSVEDVAEHLGVSFSTIENISREGGLNG